MGQTQESPTKPIQPLQSTPAFPSGISLESRVKFASIPRAFSRWTFATHPRHDELRKVIWRMLSLQSWYLWGPYGTGKTGLAVGYAHEALVQGATVLFRRLPDLLTELRATYNHEPGQLTEVDLLRMYGKVSILVLDDLGSERVTDWVGDRLYQIIGARHDEGRPTVFTSNLSLPELGQRIGERIIWRIVEMCTPERIVELSGLNLRDVKG